VCFGVYVAKTSQLFDSDAIFQSSAGMHPLIKLSSMTRRNAKISGDWQGSAPSLSVAGAADVVRT
jgi:hypothetical protein